MISLRKYCVLTAILFILSGFVYSQDELDSLLSDQLKEVPDYAIATFKSTRIITGHSIERTQQYDLDFRISHRFGQINGGGYELFGLDHSSSCFEFDYGIFNWLMTGVSRATYEKTFHGFIKLSILRQASGKKYMPVSVSYFAGIYVNSLKIQDTSRSNYFSNRLSYVHQLLIARKFNKRLSLQLSPTFLHRNLVENSTINNDVYSLGIGSRFKITKRTSFNFEYFWLYNKENISTLENTCPLSFGFDIETGSHIFQIQITNDPYMTENAFLGECTHSWSAGDIHIGFSITRIFTLSNKTKEYESLGL